MKKFEMFSIQDRWIAKKMNLWRPKQFNGTVLVRGYDKPEPVEPDAQFVRSRILALRRRKNYQAVKNVDAKMRSGCSLHQLVIFLAQEVAEAERKNDVSWEDVTAKKWKYIELINFVQAEYEAFNTPEDELNRKLFFEEV